VNFVTQVLAEWVVLTLPNVRAIAKKVRQKIIYIYVIGQHSNAIKLKMEPFLKKAVQIDAQKQHLENVTIQLKNVKSANNPLLIPIANIQWNIVM